MACGYSGVLTVIAVLSVVNGVSTESEVLYDSPPIAAAHLIDISNVVCYTLFWDQMKTENCLRKFAHPLRELASAPPRLDVVCRSNDSVAYTITPVKSLQMVALVPDDPDQPTVEVKIMSAPEYLGYILVLYPNSTFWTAALNEDGTPGTWRRGPSLSRIPRINHKYHVDIGEPRLLYHSGRYLEAVFQIVISGELTPCLKVELSSRCDKRIQNDITKGEISFTSLYRDQTLHMRSRKYTKIWKDPAVPIDDNCSLTVWRGTKMLTRIKYNTSVIPNEGAKTRDVKQNIQMVGAMAIKNLTLRAVATEFGWQVVVKWNPPKIRPEKYNITLQTTGIAKTCEVGGNATEMIIANLTGKGMIFYNVTVAGIWKHGAANVSRWGRFPDPKIVDNVRIHAEQSGDKWNIHVQWNQPALAPAKYNLTLILDDKMENASVPGTATGYTFRHVSGNDSADYYVVITTVTPRGDATTSRQARLPQRVSYQTVIILGSWSVALTLVAAVIGMYTWWRKRQDRYPYFPDLVVKLPKEFEPCLEPCTEDSWEVCTERLKLKEVIGEGAFGVVRKGILEPGGKEVAVKMLKDFPSVDEIRSFRAEMELMKSVGAHPHVVSLVGCCSGRSPRIVAEYCSRGDLLHLLRYSWDVIVSKRNAKYYNNNTEGSNYRNDLFKPQKDHSKLTPLVVNRLYDFPGELTPSDLLSFCRQIAMGMEFLASNRVVHRDLAARNILVTSDRTLKIADFGLSRDIYQENQYKQKGNGKLPIKWMALESLTNRVYTTQSDVWSFGVVVWEVVTVGGAPYPGVAAARLPRLLKAGYRMPRPTNCSEHLYEVMLACWRARPRERPTFAELHSKLDELLNSACADEYLSLELDDDAPPTPKPTRYLKRILRGNRVWSRDENYEWPLKKLQSNYYTAAPACNTKPLAV